MNMDALDNRNILMRKLVIYEFRSRDMLNLVFESCFCCITRNV